MVHAAAWTACSYKSVSAAVERSDANSEISAPAEKFPAAPVSTTPPPFNFFDYLFGIQPAKQPLKVGANTPR